uniref:Uncharacterized protein n=1 Tax=Setaria viridis TaxID=4556 RepID=A0A4U6VHK9_SETVI|nr:hypothetical protein SEVIR_3G328900v2 [Setaria viridis]
MERRRAAGRYRVIRCLEAGAARSPSSSARSPCAAGVASPPPPLLTAVARHSFPSLPQKTMRFRGRQRRGRTRAVGRNASWRQNTVNGISEKRKN